MLDAMQGLAGSQFATVMLWTLAALILLVLVLVAIKLIRSLTSGTFVAGGRNRKTRLAVMDATAVDSHRRLVLVRRDDMEHLLLIGGPTDVVVERDIRLGQPRRPALTGSGGQDLPQPRPRQTEPVAAGQRQPEPVPPRPRQPEPAHSRQAAHAPTEPRPVASPPPVPRPVAPRPPERTQQAPAPVMRPSREAASPAPAPRSSPGGLPAATQPTYQMNGSGNTAARQAPPALRHNSNSLDDTLLKELEVTFDSKAARAPAKQPPLTLDEEMTKLLGELSSHKRS